SDKEAQPQKFCFLSVIGENVRDSLKMNLQIEDEKVTGTYHWLPEEKDSRTGNKRPRRPLGQGKNKPARKPLGRGKPFARRGPKTRSPGQQARSCCLHL